MARTKLDDPRYYLNRHDYAPKLYRGRGHKPANGMAPAVRPTPPPNKAESDEGADSMSHDTFSAAV